LYIASSETAPMRVTRSRSATKADAGKLNASAAEKCHSPATTTQPTVTPTTTSIITERRPTSRMLR
jgi:hypothetical protein